MAVNDGYVYTPPGSLESGNNVFTGDDYDNTQPLADGIHLQSGNAAPSLQRPIFRYRMRAFDTTLGVIVYWSTLEVDVDGIEYQGVGPLTGIAVTNIIP